ncbi:c-type cytochrome [Geomonas sp. Red32]|uniref:c-type cytochrome n=1 Tax=Geomonas sp. Red32 TaxID=2912856 RepID=UPI00202CADB5|nr:c-type cytochrome [Geomonas sp. Red32]MCM0082417.1 c-type cytochrome [Geomonas sp. Red32]
MQRRIALSLAVVAIGAIGMAGCKKQAPQQAETPAAKATSSASAVPPPSTPAQPSPASTGLTGEALFKQYCASCHPDGGNVMNAKKTLKKADLDANGVKTADDVVKLMRNPGQGMTKFPVTQISDDDAKKVADYTLATFK